MGSIVLYIIEWAFGLLVLLALYKAVLRGTTLYRFNRFYLLGATLLSALLPLVHLTISEQTSVIGDMTISGTEFARELSAANRLFAPEVTINGSVESGTPERSYSLWAVTLVCAYCVYVLTLLIGWTRGILKAFRFLRGKPRRRVSRMVWLVTHGEAFGPFSWMNYIVISNTENGFARKASLRHEFAHIRLMHSVDLIFLLACTVVNPVCWLVLQEIKIVHEFQADDEVINRHGIDGTDYQRLLIMRTVGAEAYALASSFNLNIKQRIIMMNKEKTRQRRLIWLLMLVPLLGMTSVLFARTDNKADMIESELNDSFDPVQTSKLTQDGFIVGKVIDNDGPIADARVSVINLNGTVSYSSTTDSEGGFVLRTSNRDFTVIVSKPGYAAVMCLIQSDEPVIKLTKDNNLDPAVESIPYEPLPDDVYMVAEEAPDFPGGVVSLLTYLRNNIKYPAECRENNIQGRVIITFTVDTDGTVTDAYVAKSCNPLLDAEALRVISGMPQWTPGKNKGETVKVQYSVPLNFRLDTPGDEQRQPDWLVLHIADGNRMGVSVSGDHQAEAGSVYYMLTGMQSDENNVRRFMDSQGGGVIAGADDIESAIKDLFDGKIANMVVPKTDDNYKKMRAILDRYPDKMVLDTFLGIDELRERGWNIQTVE